MKTCIKKAWSTEKVGDLHIVENGDPKASILIASTGTRVHEDRLSAFPEDEVDEFFVDEKDYVPAPQTPASTVQTTEPLVKLEKPSEPAPKAKGPKKGSGAK